MATVHFKRSAQSEFAKFRQVYGDENKWLQSGIVDKVRALLYVVKHKKPPWSFRHSDKTQWTIIDGVMDSVEVWFEANWIESHIIVWKLDVPPRT